jgi:hypothetical protein
VTTAAVSQTPEFAEEFAAVAPTRRIAARWFIFGFALFIALLILAGRANLARVLYPAGAVVLGVLMYWRGPGDYIEFAWWFWHVTPGIRRVVDYRLGAYDPTNPMSLTPFLVSGIALFGVMRRLPELKRKQFIPWAVAGLAILYGYFVGFLRVGPLAATHALITWLVPLGFGLYCGLSWRRYPEAEEGMRRAFYWGSLVLAVYGVFQFLFPPEWDRFWMVSSGMYSVGRAFPYEVRVFSLVNAPLPFATILVAGLFIALAGKGFLRVISLSLGAVALLLSLVRSVWLAGAVGFIVYIMALPRRLVRPMVIATVITVAAVGMIPFVVPESIAGPSIRIVQDRLLTFTDLKHDVSYKDRASFLDNISGSVLDEPLGHGIGSTGVSSTLGGAAGGDTIRDFDNGIFAVLYSLGWFAGSAFLVAVTAIVIMSLPRRERIWDTTVKAGRAVAVTSLILAFGANVFEGVSAAVLWSFAGLVVAAHLWTGSSDDHLEGIA